MKKTYFILVMVLPIFINAQKLNEISQRVFILDTVHMENVPLIVDFGSEKNLSQVSCISLDSSLAKIKPLDVINGKYAEIKLTMNKFKFYSVLLEENIKNNIYTKEKESLYHEINGDCNPNLNEIQKSKNQKKLIYSKTTFVIVLISGKYLHKYNTNFSQNLWYEVYIPICSYK